MKDIFDKSVTDEILMRLNQLTPESQAQWGKMSVAQMLAHCCVTYEMAFENKHPKPGFFKKLLLKAFVKNVVVSPKLYPKNGRTAPAFIISDQKDFEKEHKRLSQYINKAYGLGTSYFDGKESHSFGSLSIDEWNNMFYKHLDHHLTQFGV